LRSHRVIYEAAKMAIIPTTKANKIGSVKSIPFLFVSRVCDSNYLAE
jgi:hypothetical protein